MKKFRQALRWIRRGALGACAAAFAFSLAGMFTAVKGGAGDNEFTVIVSAHGVVTYLGAQLHAEPHKKIPWDVKFGLFSVDYNRMDEFYGSSFQWKTLGFQFATHEEAASGGQGASSFLFITLPYWPFLLALALPELWLWRQRRRDKAIPNVRETATDVESSMIARDLPCVQCGYNLRGLPDTGRCPECGLSTANTLSLNKELAKSRPAWLRRLAAANWLLLITRILLVGAYANAFSSCFLTPHMQDYELATAFLSAMSVMYVAGIFLMIGNEHPYLRSPDRKLASMQRILAVASLICIGLGVSYQANASSFSRSLDRWEPQTVMLLICGIVLYSICVILEYRFLAKLAGRLLDRFMVEHCMIAGIGACVSNILVLGVVPIVAASETLPKNLLLFATLVCLLVLWLLFLIWTSFMNVYCAVRFARLATQAAQRWRSQKSAANLSSQTPKTR